MLTITCPIVTLAYYNNYNTLPIKFLGNTGCNFSPLVCSCYHAIIVILLSTVGSGGTTGLKYSVPEHVQSKPIATAAWSHSVALESEKF